MQLMINAHKEPNDEKQEDKEHDKEFKEVYKGVAKRGKFNAIQHSIYVSFRIDGYRLSNALKSTRRTIFRWFLTDFNEEVN